MKQYKTQYGTIFAVKEHNGAPRSCAGRNTRRHGL